MKLLHTMKDIETEWKASMPLRLCVVLGVLCVSSISGEHGKRYAIDEICKNLVNYYSLIYPLSDVKLELDFGKGVKISYLYGTGTVIFSPYIFIDRCTTFYENDTTLITAVVTDTLTIQFAQRPWVVIEDCQIKITLTSRPTYYGDEISIEFNSVRVLGFSRASARCSQVQLWPELVKSILNSAFAKIRLLKGLYFIDHDNKDYRDRLMVEALKYYMVRLEGDHLNLQRNQSTEGSCHY